MTTSATNPKIDAIRRNVQASYNELNQFITEQLTSCDSDKLYQRPAEDEWTLMESLAHIDEFMPYWANEIEKLVATPGQNFGRTMQDERRLQAISQHGSDNLQHIRATLPNSYARLDQVLSHLKDSDLVLTGHHSRYGDQTLEWFIKDFVTDHLSNHLEQMRRCLAEVK